MNTYLTTHRFFCLLALVLLSTFVVTGRSRADSKIVVKPGLEAYGQYDSNFYLADDIERSVYTYHVMPGFILGVDTPKSNLLLEYNLDAQWYRDDDDVPPGQEDSDAYDFVGHQAELTAASQLTDHLLLGIDEFFLKTREPGNSDVFSNMVDRYKYSLNSLSPRLIYQFNDRAGVSLRYINLITDYNKSIMEDSDENRGSVDFFYLPSIKSTLGLNYQVWTRNYELATPDYTSHQAMLTAMRSGKLFSLSAGVGFHDRHFHDRSFDGALIDDIDTVAWNVSLIHRNPPEETERAKSSLEVSVGQNLNDNGLGHQYFKATRLDIAAACLVLNKINLFVSGLYQKSDFKTSDREDDIYQTNLGLDYFISDELTFGLESGYEARDSNVDGKNYHNKFALITMAYQHNLGSR